MVCNVSFAFSIVTERMQGDAKSIEFDTIHLGKKPKRETTNLPNTGNFEGYMQQLIFNGKHLFEMARTGEIKNMDSTATFDKTEKLINFPITFKSAPAYLRTTLNLYGTFNLYFQLKTTQPDGPDHVQWGQHGRKRWW